jgi:hypothetical protein
MSLSNVNPYTTRLAEWGSLRSPWPLLPTGAALRAQEEQSAVHNARYHTDARWDDLPELTKHMITHYVKIEQQRRRRTHFSCNCYDMNAPHTLAFQNVLSQLRNSFLRALPLVPTRPSAAENHEVCLQAQEQMRRLFDLKFQLDASDEVNLSRFEWARVQLRLVCLDLMHDEYTVSARLGTREGTVNTSLWSRTTLRAGESMYIAHFAALEPAEFPEEGRRTQHRVQMLLPIYADAHAADTAVPSDPPPFMPNKKRPSVCIEYCGYLNFSTWRNATGALWRTRSRPMRKLP